MDRQVRSDRAAELAARLQEAAAALIAVVEPIDADRWNRVPMPSVWSIDKDAVHVSDAAVYHHWIVRLTIRRDVPSSRPAIERTQLTTDL